MSWFLRLPLSLRVYLAMLVTLSMSVLVTLLLLLFVPQLPGWLGSKTELRLASAVAIDLEGHTLDSKALDERIRGLARTLEANITIIDRGQIAASVGRPMPVPPQLLLDAARRGPLLVPGGGVPAVLSPVADGSALVMVSDALAWHIPARGFVVFLIDALIAALLLFPITRSITQPLAQLLRVTEAVGEGATLPRSGISSHDEVGRLARAFDAMAGRIETARRAERELIANVSHEVRTPIARVRMALALVDTSDPQVARRMEAVELELGELQSLAERLLEAARLDAASLPVRRQVMELRPLLEKSRAWLHGVAPGRAVSVEADTSLTALADGELLPRVFNNLLENAHKYDPSGQPVRIEAVRDGRTVRITVRDSGPGIPREDRERVFQAFYRGQQARAQSASGFGVGLALARRLVLAHEGTIRIVDQPGGGTAVEVAIPAGA
jgi:signal transduction histidine kinase